MSAHGIQIPAQNGPNGPQMPYAPGRDFINVYPQMLQSVVRFFNQNRWPELTKLVAQLEGSTEEAAQDLICEANNVFFQFISTCCQDSSERYDDVMRRVGWTQLPHSVRFAYLALLGSVTSGQLFAGLRDVSLDGESPPTHVKPLLDFYWQEARRCENALKTEEELVHDFKTLVQQCRAGGIKYAELESLLSDCKIGRA